MAIVLLCCVVFTAVHWFHRFSLSLFPGAEAPLFPAGNHLGVYRSSSCTGQRCPRRESLLPRLGTAERRGPPFHRDGRNWEEDIKVSKPEIRLIATSVRKKTRVTTALTKIYWFWRAPGWALPWDWRWKSCSEERQPPCRRKHPESTETRLKTKADNTHTKTTTLCSSSLLRDRYSYNPYLRTQWQILHRWFLKP